MCGTLLRCKIITFANSFLMVLMQFCMIPKLRQLIFLAFAAVLCCPMVVQAQQVFDFKATKKEACYRTDW